MLRRMLIVFGILSLCAPFAMAQEEEYGHSHDTEFDNTVAPLVVPAAVDFLPETGETGADDDGTGSTAAKSADKIGVNTYVDVSEKTKAGVLTPFYRFSPKFAMKAHVPIIWDMSREFFGTEVSTSGLGDITLDGEYTHALSTPGALLRFSASVKLPTGDDENTVEENGMTYGMPLGTGTTDYFLKGQYAKTTPKRGMLFNLMFRKNSPAETVQDWGTYTATTKTTAATQIVASAFGRQRLNRNFYGHMGVSIMKLGDGKSETEFSNGDPTVDNGANMAGTLVDIFPGVSYALGKFNPFVGVRIPVATSYDNEFRNDERDISFIFQFSYRPDALNK